MSPLRRSRELSFSADEFFDSPEDRQDVLILRDMVFQLGLPRKENTRLEIPTWIEEPYLSKMWSKAYRINESGGLLPSVYLYDLNQQRKAERQEAKG